MSAASVSLPSKIQYGDALRIKDTVPGVGVAVATQEYQSPRDGQMLTVKFMTRVQTGTHAGLCYSLDTPGTVQLADIESVYAIGDDGDRALVAFDKLGYRMVDGVYYVSKHEEQCNAATAYPISNPEYDLEYVQHCRKHNRKRKRMADGDAEADANTDTDSSYDSADADDIYGGCEDNDSSDSDYLSCENDHDNSASSDSEDSLDGFIVHSDEEEDNADNASDAQSNDDGFTHPDAGCDNPDVKAMQEAASQYRQWAPRTAQERAAKALIDRIEARARHSEDEKRFRRGKAALEVDR